MDSIAQSAAETEILNLSQEKFRCKTTGNIVAVEDLFEDNLVFVHLSAYITTKADWIQQLRSGSLVYNKIVQKEASARVYENTAVFVGKASLTVNGGSVYKSVYSEVYTKKNSKWN